MTRKQLEDALEIINDANQDVLNTVIEEVNMTHVRNALDLIPNVVTELMNILDTLTTAAIEDL